jgi:hypothetical protein
MNEKLKLEERAQFLSFNGGKTKRVLCNIIKNAYCDENVGEPIN